MKIKKYIAVSLVFLCLCGCGSSTDLVPPSDGLASGAAAESKSKPAAVEETPSESKTEENNETVSLSDVFSQISNEVELPEMVELNEKLLMRYYGIEVSDTSDFAGGVDSSGVGQDEIVLIKAADESKVDAIQQALQTRYDSKLTQQENYNPDEAEKIRNCKVEVKGDYVTLIISGNADKINEIVNNAL